MAVVPVLEERDLRPRTAIELADLAAAACRRSFPVLTAVSLAFALPATVVFWLALAAGGGPAVVAGSVVLAAGLVLAHAGCVDVLGDDWFGAVPDAAGSIRRTARRSGAVLGLWLVAIVQVAAGLAVLVLPGVLALVSLVPAVPTMIMERIGVVATLRRVFRLCRGRRMAQAGALVFTTALVAALLLILVQPVAAAAVVGSGRDAPMLVAAASGQLALCVLIVPLFAGVSMAAYVDLRVRKEGLDLLYLLSMDGRA